MKFCYSKPLRVLLTCIVPECLILLLDFED